MLNSSRAVRRATWIGLSTAVATPILWAAGVGARALLRSRALAVASRPYSRGVAAPRGRILVVGDSIAAGVGVARPEESLPGLLAEHHPGVEIVNLAVIGARWRDLSGQLTRAGNRPYDLALIVAAGNDIVRATRGTQLERDVDWTLRFAAGKARHTVVIGTPNIGTAPIFRGPLRPLMRARTRLVRATVREACARHGAGFVDLYLEAADDFVARDPGTYYAADGFHPSAASHRYAWERLEASVPLERVFHGEGRFSHGRRSGAGA